MRGYDRTVFSSVFVGVLLGCCLHALNSSHARGHRPHASFAGGESVCDGRGPNGHVLLCEFIEDGLSIERSLLGLTREQDGTLRVVTEFTMRVVPKTHI